MPDVSRVEYDAALKRVQKLRVCAPCPAMMRCTCRNLTLAALGLDEPPTEDAGPVHTQECEDYTFCHHAATGGDAPCICGAVVSPAESPKACPTCNEYRSAIRSALDVMEGLTDEELGTGGGARRAYAGLWHAYHAVPAGIPTGASRDDPLHYNGTGHDGGAP